MRAAVMARVRGGARRERVRQPSDLLDELTAQAVVCEIASTTRLLWTTRTRTYGTVAELAVPEAEIVGPGVIRLPLSVEDGEATALRVRLPAYDGERFVGFGERADGIDQRGRRIDVWADGRGIAVGESLSPWLDQLEAGWNPFPRERATSGKPLPWFISSRGYGFLVATTAPVLFDLGNADPRVVTCEIAARTAEVFVFFADSPAALLELATMRSGRPRPLPDWALAPWNHALGGQEEALRMARLLRREGIPSSVLWLPDWAGAAWRPWFADWVPAWVSRSLERWGQHVPSLRCTPASDRYPEVSALIARLHGDGFKVHATVTPYVTPDDPDFAAALDAGHLVADAAGAPRLLDHECGPVAQIDFAKSAARAWCGRRLEQVAALGFDGWSHEGGERTPADGGLEEHNRTPVAWAELGRETLDAVHPGDFVLLSRTAGFGQVASTSVFAGDEASTDFERHRGLPSVVRSLLSAGLSGLPLWTTDIGGSTSFLSRGRDVETLMRWTELAALLPVMRTHPGTHPGWNVSFDRDAATLSHYRTYARLHTALFPLFRALVDDAVRRGLPVCRPMLFESPNDPMAWAIDDQFLLGPDLLVAPVIERGRDDRFVQLPRPGAWIDLWRGTRHAGGTRLRVSCPVGVIPLFLRTRGLLATLDTPVDSLVRRAAGVTEPVSTLDDAERSLALTIGPDFAGPVQLYDGTRIWWAGERQGARLEPPAAEEPHALLPERMLAHWRRVGVGVGRAGTIACGRRSLAVESPIERRFTVWVPGR